jgi:hypothetical protein
VWNFHATENEFSACGEAMSVVTIAGSDHEINDECRMPNAE